MSWLPDRLVPGYECFQIDLSQESTVAGEPEGSLRACLVRRAGGGNRRAVLFLHGWNDYFFHTHVADFFADQGFDFYALDLRRYGRSLVPGQFAGYIGDVSDYYTELDAALELIASDHESVSLIGHSTGGLVGALWANDRPGRLDAVILNAPWLELQASTWLGPVTKPVLAALSTANPVYPIPLSDNGFYLRSLHTDFGGEWSYDRNLKGDPAFKVRVGWFNAILAAQARVAAGLTIDAPVLVLTSARSDFRKTWHEDLKKADIVLDVDQIVSRLTSLGDTVTSARIQDGVHDLFLSPEPVRMTAFAAVRRWMTGYLPR